MANPTTNFGWVMPTSTSLVTNLPADFNTFGQAVDTSMAQLKGGTTGQILSKTSATDMAFTWITNDVGDITAVTAGTGISGGGTSGAVTITNSMATAITTAGDTLYGTGSGTFSRLGIGTTGQVLTVASGVPSWASAASGAMTLISRQSFSNVAGTGTTFDGVFTSTYKTYLVVIETIVGTTYADDLQLQFRYAGPTTAVTNYYGSSITTDYSISTVSNTQTSNASQATLNLFIGTDTSTPTSGYLFFQNVGNSAQKGYYQGSIFNADSFNLNVVGGANNNPRTYTGFLLKSSSTNVTGTVAVYGLATA